MMIHHALTQCPQKYAQPMDPMQNDIETGNLTGRLSVCSPSFLDPCDPSFLMESLGVSKAVLMGDEGCGGTALLELHCRSFVMVTRAPSFFCCSALVEIP